MDYEQLLDNIKSEIIEFTEYRNEFIIFLYGVCMEMRKDKEKREMADSLYMNAVSTFNSKMINLISRYNYIQGIVDYKIINNK